MSGAEIDFAQGRLDVGEPAAVPVIKAVMELANPQSNVIFDAPPGTACTMVEAVCGSGYCLLVTEPTPFGLNDLELALGVTRLLEVPTGVVLNRCSIGDRALADYCREQTLPILMEIPFERNLAEA